jgi:hypothetical protein
MSGDQLDTEERSTLVDDPSGAAQATRDARGYHQTARGFQASGAAASVVFNVAAMAVERYLMAICYLHGVEPIHHTFGSMMSEVDALIDVPPGLSEQIAALDGIFRICSFDDYHHGEPDPADAARALDNCQGLDHVLASASRRAGRAA